MLDCAVFLSIIVKKTFLTGNSYFNKMQSLHHHVIVLSMSCSLLQENVLFNILLSSAVVLDVTTYWICYQLLLIQSRVVTGM